MSARVQAVLHSYAHLYVHVQSTGGGPHHKVSHTDSTSNAPQLVAVALRRHNDRHGDRYFGRTDIHELVHTDGTSQSQGPCKGAKHQFLQQYCTAKMTGARAVAILSMTSTVRWTGSLAWDFSPHMYSRSGKKENNVQYWVPLYGTDAGLLITFSYLHVQ